MLNLGDLAKYPFKLTAVGEPIVLTTLSGPRHEAHMFHLAAGFPVWWVLGVLQRNAMKPATDAQLKAFADVLHAVTVPVIALGSPKVSPFLGDWEIESYPALLPDGTCSSLSVDYKEYNHNALSRIDEAAVVLAIA